MGKAWKHFKTITHHKLLVAQGCFRVGLYKQGLLHDLSKYSPTEFRVGVRYFQGDRSPNAAEREENGYSAAWLHHKGRNKHHYEYWFDYQIGDQEELQPVPMPDKYIAEMLMDRIAASKIYLGDNYTDAASWEHYSIVHGGKEQMHPRTKEILEKFLKMLAEEGEEKTFACIRAELVKKKNR